MAKDVQWCSISEVTCNGESENKKVTRDDILKCLCEDKLPLRDLKMLLKKVAFPSVLLII